MHASSSSTKGASVNPTDTFYCFNPTTFFICPSGKLNSDAPLVLKMEHYILTQAGDANNASCPGLGLRLCGFQPPEPTAFFLFFNLDFRTFFFPLIALKKDV
jgi:hypothetical protein